MAMDSDDVEREPWSVCHRCKVAYPAAPQKCPHCGRHASFTLGCEPGDEGGARERLAKRGYTVEE